MSFDSPAPWLDLRLPMRIRLSGLTMMEATPTRGPTPVVAMTGMMLTWSKTGSYNLCVLQGFHGRIRDGSMLFMFLEMENDKAKYEAA